ncbi:PREDICTED: sulfate transporter 4.1, chloroplastic-like [Camelina sativa]|uniref:Sulfate transporter 4.1, chloroplastic-like n=1 Tax=Camelina sativa TaxID=90675 RepID=A0ABM0T2H9_CAMSA|nr:PREDICTED: sulfate transporter 4.1, chloroplastic-like [Camelina sativa]
MSYASLSVKDLTSLVSRSGTGSSSSSSSSPLKPPGQTRPVKVIPLQHPDTSNEARPPSIPFDDIFSGWTAKIKRMRIVDWVDTLFPCFRWIRTYKWKEYLKLDLMAGITVGIMLVPQAMSYAKLAGLPPIYGLYSSFVPIFVYAIFGSSRQLAIGPVALVSLLVSNALGGIADTNEELHIELAILLAFLVGVLECIMGLLRLGWLIRFISHSVISGFTSASAIVIGLSQVKYFLGYSIARSSKIVPIVESIIAGADKFQWPPFLMGSLILVILQVMKHVGKAKKELQFLRAAAPLTGIVLGTTIAKVFHPPSISLVGEIPQGLPTFSFPRSFDHAKTLLPTSALITGVAILESVGIAKALAAKNRYELDSNSELFGLGVANILGSLFSAYPSTGSFSRSAVNNESEAKTGLSGLITGIIIGCSLLFLTPMFKYIPQCALAAIVISAVSGLVDYDEAIFLWRVDKRDFTLWTITSTTTLFFGIEIGVLVGVGFSLAFVIHESANPHIAVLGRLPGTTVYRNIKQYPEAYTYNGIVIVRIDAPIYFANISYIKDRLREYEVAVDKYKNRGLEVERINFVILEMSPVTHIDSSAVEALKELYQEYKTRDIQLAISNPNKDVHLTIARSGMVELVGKEWYFVRVHDAVQVCLQYVQSSNLEDKKTSFSRRYGSDNNSSSFKALLQEPLLSVEK